MNDDNDDVDDDDVKMNMLMNWIKDEGWRMKDEWRLMIGLCRPQDEEE